MEISTPARAMAVFAHPDDEAYSAAGLLALLARRGVRVEVVCATRGEAGGAGRPGELVAACRALGAGPPAFLELPDGGVRASDAPALTPLLQRARPAVIVTHGPDGAYGHRDHIECAALVAAAVDALPTAARPRVLAAAFPRGLFARVCRALRRAGAAAIDPGIDPDALGIDPADADLRVDVAAVREVKLAAIAAHQSQLRGGDPHSFLRGGIVEHLLELELFTVASGAPLPPGCSDPLAGL